MSGGQKPPGGADLAADPVTQFTTWFNEVSEAGVPQPNAMVLATASAAARPSARTVLLKSYDVRGFVFYTNHGSRKGAEIAENPRVTALFPWHSVGRQVIVGGEVVPVSRAESEAYFHSRPRGSQLGAWASERQSAVISSREELTRRFEHYARRWPEGTEIPLPDFWGGLRVVPAEVEFWQTREDRLHDRLEYAREGGAWIVRRRSP